MDPLAALARAQFSPFALEPGPVSGPELNPRSESLRFFGSPGTFRVLGF